MAGKAKAQADEDRAEEDEALRAAPEGEAVEVVVADDESGKTDATADAVADLNRQMATLRRERETERAARAEAERRATEAAQQAERYRGQVDDGRMQVIVTAIEKAEGDAVSAKTQYRAAMEAGDFDKAADAQADISRAMARLTQLENGKQALEDHLTAEKENASRPSQPSAPANNSVDAVIANVERTAPRSAAWLREHTECLTDRRLNAKMMAAHEDALFDGLTADSPEYVEYIEKQIYPRREARQAAQRSAPAAPVSREAISPGSGRTATNKVTLTPEEREAADIAGISYTEYARNKRALEAENQFSQARH